MSRNESKDRLARISEDERDQGISFAIRDRFLGKCSLPQRESITSRELLRRIDMPEPLPPFLEHTLGISDELQVIARGECVHSLTEQWNGVFGHWHYDSERLLGGSDTRSHLRTYSTIMRMRADLTYRIVHETAHRMIYEIGLRGLFHKLNLLHSPSNPAWYLHVFGEMFAGFMSHYEYGISAYDYWRNYWKPAAETIYKENLNSGRAALQAGLGTREERGRLIFLAYFAGSENPNSSPVTTLFQVNELAAMWSFERAYAIKSHRAAKRWWDNYWNDSVIRDYVEEFVPNTAAPIWLGHRNDPLEISTLDDLRTVFPLLPNEWERPSKLVDLHLRARRAVQRDALAVSQLLRLIQHESLIVSVKDRMNLRETALNALSELLALFKVLQVRELGDHAEAECYEYLDTDMKIKKSFIGELKRISRGDRIFHTHPGMYGLDMSDLQEGYDFRFLGDLKTCWSSEERATYFRRIQIAMNRIASDSFEVLRLCRERQDLRPIIREASTFVLEASLLVTTEPSADDLDFVGRVQRWYEDVVRRNLIVHCYEWDWVEHLPFIDPLIGFRVT